MCVAVCPFVTQNDPKNLLSQTSEQTTIFSILRVDFGNYGLGSMTMPMTLAPESQAYNVMMPMELASQST